MTARFLDPLGVGNRRAPRVTIGSVDVTEAVRGGSVRLALDSRGEVDLRLDPTALPHEPVDYLAPITYRSSGSGVRADFSGHVDRADAHDDAIAVRAQGASLLVEHSPGVLASRNVSPQQLVYAMARSAGMPEEHLVIEDLDANAPEVFEVVVPLHGLTLSARARLAGLALLPGAEAMSRLEGLDLGDELASIRADVFAISLQSARRVYDAERAGLQAIETGVDWLAARFRHALALSVDGTVLPFSRESARARPRRGDLVVVRGLRSGQRWLRSIDSESIEAVAHLRPDDPLLAVATSELKATDRLALAACRRATSRAQPLERVQALFEAVECLVAGTALAPRWAKADLKAAKRAIPEGLPDGLAEAVKQAIGQLNYPGLMQRFRALVEQEDLPISSWELELLDAMRRIRNDAVHGRAATTPSPADLDHATAVICRITIEYLVGRLSP